MDYPSTSANKREKGRWCGFFATGQTRFVYVDHKKSGLRIYFLGDADVPPTVAPSIPVKTSQNITPGWRSVYPHFLDVGEGDEIPRVADFLLRKVYLHAPEKVVGGNAESRKELSDYQDDKDDDNGIVETEPANNEEDEIRRITQLIKARQGQATFRDALIAAYNGKCAVTRCDAVRALEASHIKATYRPAVKRRQQRAAFAFGYSHSVRFGADRHSPPNPCVSQSTPNYRGHRTGNLKVFRFPCRAIPRIGRTRIASGIGRKFTPTTTIATPNRPPKSN